MFPHQLHALVVGLNECLEAGLEGLLLHRQHGLKCQLLLIQNIVDNSVDVGVLGRSSCRPHCLRVRQESHLSAWTTQVTERDANLMVLG